MRVDLTIAPPGSGQIKTDSLKTPNSHHSDVCVLTVSGLEKPGFDQICVNGANHGQVLVALGNQRYIFEPTPDGKGLTVGAFTGPSLSSRGHSLLHGHWQPIAIEAAPDSGASNRLTISSQPGKTT